MMEVKSNFKMTELGKIPVEWEIVKQGEIATFLNGRAYKQTEFTKSGTPIIRIQNLTGGNNFVYSDMQLDDNKYIDYGDLIYAWSATFGPYIWRGPKGIYHYHIWKIEVDENLLDKYFFFYRLDQLSVEMHSQKNGSAFAHITKGGMESHLVPLPPLNEQQKIAEILSTVDEQIEQTDQLIERTKELKKGLMQQLLTKGIGHTEFKQTELGEIPDEWSLLRLQEVLKVMYGKSQTKVEVEESDIPILGTGGIIGWSKEPLYSKKSVLIGRKGTIDKPVYIDKPFWTIDTLFYTDIETTKADVKFIYYLFQSIDWYRYNEATGVPSLSSKNILNILFACPSLKEQKRIASILSAVDEDIEGYEKVRAKYEELKKGLMQQLLTGKTRVKVD